MLSYYGGTGPSRDKLETFIRNYLVYEGASVPDALIDTRYAASVDPEVVADPPLRRPSGPMALRTLWRMDLTRDNASSICTTPTLVLWGRDDKVNRPAGGPMLANLMPNAELVMTSRTGHWMQWERADLFNRMAVDFLSAPSVFDAMNIFGSVHLGYIVVETEKFTDWRRFGRDAIGMHLDETGPDVLRFRLDDHQCRFLLRRGPAEDVTALGWQVDDHRTFDEILARVTRHGVPVIEGPPRRPGCAASSGWCGSRALTA